jgi:hypothetical protein
MGTCSEECSDMRTRHNTSCGDDEGSIVGNGLLDARKLDQKGRSIVRSVSASLDS